MRNEAQKKLAEDVAGNTECFVLKIEVQARKVFSSKEDVEYIEALQHTGQTGKVIYDMKTNTEKLIRDNMDAGAEVQVNVTIEKEGGENDTGGSNNHA